MSRSLLAIGWQVPGVPLSLNHSLFSLVIGHTAWAGTNICAPAAGKTMVVSGAAGAVGSIASQLAKLRGAKVIGIAGGPAKCELCTGFYGMDGAIDYKSTTETLEQALDRCAHGDTPAACLSWVKTRLEPQNEAKQFRPPELLWQPLPRPTL